MPQINVRHQTTDLGSSKGTKKTKHIQSSENQKLRKKNLKEAREENTLLIEEQYKNYIWLLLQKPCKQGQSGVK